MKELDETSISVSESNDSLVTTTNNSSQSFNPSKSFLFGDKSSTSIFEKTTTNAPLFGSKPLFEIFSTDSTKTDDTKSTNLFNISPSTTCLSIFGTSSAAGLFPSVGSTEIQNTNLSSSFSKTDDIKSKTESLFNFSSKTDSPFKFGVMTKDTKLVFGQNLFSVKDKSVDEGIYFILLV